MGNEFAILQITKFKDKKISGELWLPGQQCKNVILEYIFNQVFKKKNWFIVWRKWGAGRRAGGRRLFLLISFLGGILLWGKGRFHSIFGAMRFSTLPPGGPKPVTQKLCLHL
jgi:hypothetical protein